MSSRNQVLLSSGSTISKTFTSSLGEGERPWLREAPEPSHEWVWNGHMSLLSIAHWPESCCVVLPRHKEGWEMWSFFSLRRKGRYLCHYLVRASHFEVLCSLSPEITCHAVTQHNFMFYQALSSLKFSVVDFVVFTSFLISLPFFPFLYLKGNPIHPKMLQYNVTSSIMFCLVCSRKQYSLLRV